MREITVYHHLYSSKVIGQFYVLETTRHSDHLTFFRHMQGTRLGSKRVKNAQFEQFGGRFEVV